MSYQGIINQNKGKSSVSWWPEYAYHFTDVRNAVNILEQGYLYSRANALEMNLMANDNASQQVIDMTDYHIMNHVRFYFRPLTPTQYYNEGYKHSAIRYDHDVNANVPVPVFFFFNLGDLLSDEQTVFSSLSEAGHGGELLQGENAFAGLDFQKIYADGPYRSEDSTERHIETAARQAEILYPNKYSLENHLEGIVCRNQSERETLLNLLRERSEKLYTRYQNKIKVIRNHVYYNNGLYIEDCAFFEHNFTVIFSEYYARKRFVENQIKETKSLPLSVKIDFEWSKNNGKVVVDKKMFDLTLDYLRKEPLRFTGVPVVRGANELGVRIYFDGHIMSSRKFVVEGGQVI